MILSAGQALLAFDICSSFVPELVSMVFVLIGGPLSLIWYVLIALKFLRLGSGSGTGF